MTEISEIKTEVTNSKIKIPSKNNDTESKPIIFFLDETDIVYIGKTDKNILQYVIQRSKEIKCTHYYTKFIDKNKIDNLIADLVLGLKPYYHTSLPVNTKYISNTKAKELYHVSKIEFKKHWKEHGKMQFGNTLFLEKKIFDDIFMMEAYNKNMPKIGTLLNNIEDYNNLPINLDGIEEKFSSTEQDDGTMVQVIERKYTDKSYDNYQNLKLRIKHSYVVTNIISPTSFEAYSEYKNEIKIFNTSNNFWKKLPHQWEQERIIENYLNSLDK